MEIVLRGGRLMDPQRGMDRIGDLVLRDGVIQDVIWEPQIAEPSAERRVIDVMGKWVVPAWVDMHVHLREPGEEYKETIATGTAAAVAGGFGAVACMPNTKPVNDCAAVTQFIVRRASEEGYCRVYPVAAISKGLRGEELAEFGELREAGAVAVSDDGRPVMNAALMRRALEYAKAFDLLVITHAEDLALSQGGHMHEGFVSTKLGLQGIPAAAEAAMIARDVLLAELTGGRLHVAHVSTEASVWILREAKRRGIPVTCETAPHYFTLTDEAVEGFDTVYKVNPPLRTRRDVEAIKEALADGTIDVIATDHAPHSLLEKETEFQDAANGMIGLESALPLVLNLIREGVADPLTILAKVTCKPMKILGLPFDGLEPGSPANVTVIDPDAEWVVDPERFQSKGRNCPFRGWSVRGRAMMTVVDGVVRYSMA
ncbi:dihydroorotase [Desulfosoma caldarium]|uniref:Dihydroorotase n=2 Tax=Desulfosoma caldarium TaxID=610254 RepID=A0A3N1UIK9_9BACT|nr:dihydroorotase [Desulfosoma caldarium]ROQ91094.1 dihydroorotase [Desulfosoma caldarium]